FRHVQAILLVGLHLREILLTLAHDDVAGRARAAAPAVVLERDVVGERDVEERARLAVIGQRVLGVVDLDGLVQGKERHAVHGHHDDSMISVARLDESAPLSAASIISSARCSVAWLRAVVASRMRSRSCPARAPSSASSADAMPRRSSSPTRLPPWLSARRTWVRTVSASLRASMRSRALTSASAYWNDSSTMRSTSASARPYVGFTSIDVALPVRCSRAATWRIPLASMRKVTSILGMPAGIGSIPPTSKRASDRQSLASSRSPCT